MHASFRHLLALLLTALVFLTGCSHDAPQPAGIYAGPHFVVRFDTTSRLTWVGQLGMPDIHATYTQSGDTLDVVSDKTAAKHFEATLTVAGDGRFITMTQMKDMDTGQVMKGSEIMSKVLSPQ
jgi:hypothetical protein